MNRRLNPLARMRWLQFSNQSGQTIPAFAVLLINGVDSNGILQVTQPSDDSLEPDQIAFNSFLTIGSGNSGSCTQDWPAYCLYNSSDGTPANGQVWGTAKNSWSLRNNNNQQGFTIQGGTQGSGNYARVMAGAQSGGGAPIILARLSSGSGPGYSFVEIQEQQGGSYKDKNGGQTGGCYEINGAVNLPTGALGTGFQVVLFKVNSQDWLFAASIQGFTGQKIICVNNNPQTWQITNGEVITAPG
jgi:hypothetical protein